MRKSEKGVVGPNAVIQLIAALENRPNLATAVFAQAGCSDLHQTPPQEMIDQAIPARLFDALWQLAPTQAADIAAQAGRLTGQYILAHRIPRIAQRVLRILPRRLATALLLRAILRNSWTFAGSGQCHIEGGRFILRHNPMPMQNAAWHCGVLGALFTALVSPHCRVQHSNLPDLGDAFAIVYAPK